MGAGGGNGGAASGHGDWIGHHGDDEYEYEIHHFEKYHTEDDGEEKFVHPEDIEHVRGPRMGVWNCDTDGEQFAKHEAAEEAEREEAEREKATVNLKNVPLKFRRQQGRR